MDLRIRRPFRRLRNDDGNVAIEYALLGAALGCGLMSALTKTKANLNQNFNRVSAGILLTTGHIARCDAPGACLPVGTDYGIGYTNPASGGLFTSGWSDLEAGHIWSTGTASTMTLDLGSLINTNGTSATLNLSTSAFMAQANQAAVTTDVTVNGVSLGTITYDKGYQGGTKSLTLNNAAMLAIAQNNGVAVLNFQSSASGRPVDYGYNSDGRNLGIAVGAISVIPAT